MMVSTVVRMAGNRPCFRRACNSQENFNGGYISCPARVSGSKMNCFFQLTKVYNNSLTTETIISTVQ